VALLHVTVGSNFTCNAVGSFTYNTDGNLKCNIMLAVLRVTRSDSFTCRKVWQFYVKHKLFVFSITQCGTFTVTQGVDLTYNTSGSISSNKIWQIYL